ncbi:MAG: hydrogenase expression/formation C-terminal domain-containing protein [Rhodoferax sp.]
MDDKHSFPIPVVASLGPGSQAEEAMLDYMAMPQSMTAYAMPSLADPARIARHAGALRALRAVRDQLRSVAEKLTDLDGTRRIDLSDLTADELQQVNQVLGEGEVSAQVLNENGVATVSIQESVFAGVWRVIQLLDDGQLLDSIEVGSVPHILREVARLDAAQEHPDPLPDSIASTNIPSILVEIEAQRGAWRAGQSAYVINLTLLPLAPTDIGYLDYCLGTGRVQILSRGYGNCRITNCCVPHTWRVVYYNSEDTVILNSVEVTEMPEVACAAPEDLRDSVLRLDDVLQWIGQSEQSPDL